jgi:hypothetical protein
LPRGLQHVNCPGGGLAARDRGLPGGNAVLEIDPVARRYAQQIGCTPDDVILELADLAIGVNRSHIISTIRSLPSSFTERMMTLVK